MSVQVENLGELKRKIVLRISPQEVTQEKQKRLQQIQANYKKPGFRPGKVPLDVIDREHGKDIEREAVEEKIKKVFFDFCKDQSIRVAGAASIKLQEPKDNGMDCDVNFEVFPDVPEINAAHFENHELKTYLVDVDDADVNSAIKLLQKMMGETKEMPADYRAQKDDVLELSIKSMAKQEPLSSFSFEKITLALNEKDQQAFDFLIDHVVGMQAGDTKICTVTIPSVFNSIELVGKTVEIEITIKKVMQNLLAELDDDLFAKTGEEDLASLRISIKKSLESEVQSNLDKIKQKQIYHHLLKNIDVLLPEVLVKEKLQEIYDNALEQVRQNSNLMGQVTRDMPNFEFFAEDQTKFGLLLSKFMETANIQAPFPEIKELVETRAQNYEDPASFKSFIYKNEDAYANLRNELLLKKCHSQIFAFASNVTEEKVNVEQLGQVLRALEQSEFEWYLQRRRERNAEYEAKQLAEGNQAKSTDDASQSA